ncbi:MAG: hypothetical protein QNJ47_11125 [Nostocaceae cyanobacterium]|nr:hypothetical protein [Nostocaceae cyanobacterium]
MESLKDYLKPLWVNLSPSSPEALKYLFPCRMLLANWVRDPTLLKAVHSASTFTHKLVGRDVKFYVSTSGGMAKNHYVRGDTPDSPLISL